MKILFSILLIASLASCTSIPKPESFFQLSAQSLKYRALQSRIVETAAGDELFSASATVLQDLGFQIEETDSEAGMLRAVKERSAREYSQEIARFFIFILGLFGQTSVIIPVDLHQQIAATLVMFPVENSNTRFNVRIVFHRAIWKSDGHSGNQTILPGAQTMEMIYDSGIYQHFFAKLSKSVFLEIHQI